MKVSTRLGKDAVITRDQDNITDQDKKLFDRYAASILGVNHRGISHTHVVCLVGALALGVALMIGYVRRY
jgi:hypothetical protein